jgi:hypothetical protein
VIGVAIACSARVFRHQIGVHSTGRRRLRGDRRPPSGVLRIETMTSDQDPFLRATMGAMDLIHNRPGSQPRGSMAQQPEVTAVVGW